MRKIMLIAVSFIALSFNALAQGGTGKISGTVIDGNTRTIESATIMLLNDGDSSMAKIGLADKTGRYEFDGITDGRYLVSVSAVGHSTAYSEVVSLDAAHQSIELKTLELLPVAKAISGVTVTSKKPLIEQKAGRTLINVDASPTNSGLNALELLEKSPG